MSWLFRLREQRKLSLSAAFLTFTYDDEHLPLSFNGNPTLNKTDVQRFLKRLRKKCQAKIKYYFVGEYGTQTKRPHYHCIIFNLPASALRVGSDLLADTWGLGLIQIDPCNMGSMSYVTKYLMKGRWQPLNELDDRDSEFSLMSKGMGLSYLTPQMKKYHIQNHIGHCTLPGGSLLPLPRYYVNKIFQDKNGETDYQEKFAWQETVSQEAERWREWNASQFINATHEIKWKKDQERKEKKLRKLKRLGV